MNRSLFVFLVIFFCSLAITARGQKPDETIGKEVALEIKKKVALKKDIKKLEEDSINLRKNLQKFVSQIANDSLELKQLETNLKAKKESISKDSVKILKDCNDSLKREYQRLSNDIDSLKEEIKQRYFTESMILRSTAILVLWDFSNETDNPGSIIPEL